MNVPFWIWAAVLAFIVVILAIDLFAHGHAHVIGVREAAVWSGVWGGLRCHLRCEHTPDHEPRRLLRWCPTGQHHQPSPGLSKQRVQQPARVSADC